MITFLAGMVCGLGIALIVSGVVGLVNLYLATRTAREQEDAATIAVRLNRTAAEERGDQLERSLLQRRSHEPGRGS